MSGIVHGGGRVRSCFGGCTECGGVQKVGMYCGVDLDGRATWPNNVNDVQMGDKKARTMRVVTRDRDGGVRRRASCCTPPRSGLVADARPTSILSPARARIHPCLFPPCRREQGPRPGSSSTTRRASSALWRRLPSTSTPSPSSLS